MTLSEARYPDVRSTTGRAGPPAPEHHRSFKRSFEAPTVIWRNAAHVWALLTLELRYRTFFDHVNGPTSPARRASGVEGPAPFRAR